jgi:phosphatidylserine decarboxylase
LTVNQDKNSDLELLKVFVYLVAGEEFKILKFGKTGSLIIDFFEEDVKKEEKLIGAFSFLL